MLTLRVHAGDTGAWRAVDDGWRSGTSAVHVVAPDLLHLAAWAAPSRTVLLVARRGGEHGAPVGRPGRVPEPRRVSAAQLEAVVAAAAASEGDLVLVDLRTGVPGPVRAEVTAGVGTAVPLYLSTSRTTLHGHWDLTSHLRHADVTDLDPVLAAHFLHRSVPYASTTLWRGVRHLTERATAVWTGPTDGTAATLDVRYPPSAPDVPPARLRPGADPLAVFRDGMRTVLAHLLPGDGTPTVLELSGGADSAAVLAAAHDALVHDGRDGAARSPRLLTYGLLVPGRRGALQSARRDLLARRFGAADRTVRVDGHPPLDVDGPRLADGALLGPHEEIYTEAFLALLALAADQGARSVLTGTGGDELFLPHPTELAADAPPAWSAPPPHVSRAAAEAFADTRWTVDHAPRTVVPRSTLGSLACRAPVFVRSGVLPVAPFATAPVVRFCRALPRTWRADKRIERRYLAGWGLPRRVTHPRLSEGFGDFFQATLRGPAAALLTSLFREPRLADLGLVDADRLRRDLAEHVRTGGVPDHRFYEIAALELAVRGVEDGPRYGMLSR